MIVLVVFGGLCCSREGGKEKVHEACCSFICTGSGGVWVVGGMCGREREEVVRRGSIELVLQEAGQEDLKRREKKM